MASLHFEWDEAKAKRNVKKHGVSFEEAAGVFSDERALLIADPDSSDDEDRFVILGVSRALRVLVVCHCYRSNDEVIRLISARRANRKETTTYLEG